MIDLDGERRSVTSVPLLGVTFLFLSGGVGFHGTPFAVQILRMVRGGVVFGPAICFDDR